MCVHPKSSYIDTYQNQMQYEPHVVCTPQLQLSMGQVFC